MPDASLRTNLAPNDPSAAQQLAAALAQATARQLPITDVIDLAARLDGMQRGMAAALYKTWIAFNTDNPGLHVIYFNYAVCLSENQDIAGAVNALRETIRLKPDFGPPHINLGSLLDRAGQAGQAVEAWLSLVHALSAITPDAMTYKTLALKQIGRVLEGAEKDNAAEDALRQAIELDPTQQDAVQHWIALRQRQCKWPALAGSERISIGKLQAGMSPLSAAYFADDPVYQLAVAHTYARRTIGLPNKPRAVRLEAVPTANAARRLRIGYVSSDLREHAVGFAMTDVMELHDRTKVEVFAYYCGVATTDPTQQRTIRAVEHWRDLTGVDDGAAAQQIKEDGIDILVDLNGYTKDARTKVFAMRPAPVAVNWFGFPGSMGSPYHHYLIADHAVIPPSHESFYSETVMRLPCYQPNDRKRLVAAMPTRQEAGLPEAAFVFCCLNGMQKLTLRCFEHWMTILREVPGSVLWLLSGPPETNDRLRQAAEQRGIEGTRIVFADKRRNPDHLARMALADLFLDTFPYGAHTTASDALWVGLPVLTLSGRSFASRVCGSLVTAAGAPELVCRTHDDYIARAIALGRDQAQLTSIRARLRAGRDTCTLFDTPNLVRSLEALYQEMHQARLAGAVPQPNLRNLDLYHEIGAASDLEANAALETPAYLDHYVQRIADLDSVFPVMPDDRLWQPAGR